MGSHNIGFKLPKTKFPTEQSVREWYKGAVTAATSEYGTDPYNGTISTTKGIRFNSSAFDDENKADKFILDNTEKWSHVLAVTLKDSTGEYWLVGGWAAS